MFLCIILIGVALRLTFLSQPMRFDEAFTYLRFASLPLSEGLSSYPEPNNHLFHTLLVHISTSLLGSQPWAIRLPALLAGIVLVPITYWVARALYNANTGYLAAALVATSSVLIEFSTNARGYTLVCCCFMLLLTLAHHLRSTFRSALLPPPLTGEGRGGGKVWLLFIIIAALGIYTVPTMLYPLVIVTVWLLISTPPSRRLLLRLFAALIVTAVIIVVLYLPVIVVSGVDSLVNNRYVQVVSWQNFPPQFAALVNRIVILWTRDVPTPIAILLLLGALISLAIHRRQSPLLAAIVFITAATLVRPIVGFPRTWLFLLPLYLMCASAGLVYTLESTIRLVGANRQVAPTIPFVDTDLPKQPGFSPPLRVRGGGWGEGFIIFLTLLLAFAVLNNQSVPASEETGVFPGAQAVARLLEARLQPGDGILALRPADAPLEYYFRLDSLSAPPINAALESSHRLFVIVYEPATTLADTLARANLSADDYSTPQLLLRIEPTALYLIER